MNLEVDQFGRSAINSDDLSGDKSKRILDALSDIKNQLQNDEYIPKQKLKPFETHYTVTDSAIRFFEMDLKNHQKPTGIQ